MLSRLLYILYVDQQNNNDNMPAIENKIIDVKYSSTKYKQFCDKKQKTVKEIIDNIDKKNNTNSSNTSNDKIDLYNDK